MYCYGNNNPWKFSKSLDVSSWKFKDMECSESSSFRPLSNTNSELSENTKTSSVKKSVIPEDKFNKYSKRMPKHQDQDKRLKDFDELMLKYQKQILCESLQAQLDPSILHFVKDILQLELPETDDHVNARDESGTKNSVSDEESSRIRSLGSVTTKSPYKSLLKTLQYTKDEDTYLYEQTEMSKELENHIENVTKGFCDWATKLSQSTNNTQPLTSTELRKMFISGDDQLTPDMFIPISIQDLTVIPREIRHLQQYPSKGEKLEKLLKKYENKKATGKNQRIVWYLKPTLWFQNSQIMDEKDTLTNKKENSTTSMGLDPELKSMHISQAYRQFVKDNKLTLPKFLSSGHEDMTCKK